MHLLFVSGPSRPNPIGGRTWTVDGSGRAADGFDTWWDNPGGRQSSNNVRHCWVGSAGLGWFAKHGEVTATQSVAMLLEESVLKVALLRRLGEAANTDLGAVTMFHAEPVHDDLARPDLEGRDGRGHPLVVIEAKFGASLTTAQLQAYVMSQLARLTGGTRGVLVVRRCPTADRRPRLFSAPCGTKAMNRPPSPRRRAPLSSPGMSCSACGTRRSRISQADDRGSVTCDLWQLRGLCKTSWLLDIPLLGLVATGGDGWQDREADGKRVVDEASASFPHESRRGRFP